MRLLPALCGALLAASLNPAHGDTLPAPTEAPVLTVSGAIAVTNADGIAAFDMEMLSNLPAAEYRTTTLWTEGTRTFTGVPLADLLATLGVVEGTIRASAINDYSIEIPVDSVTPEAPIVAYALDGAPMSLRQKGPLWIVYPYDSNAAYRSEVIYSRSIWQLDRMEIVE